MKIELYEKPKNPTIIEGFPGFGFVATIAMEYLLDHLTFKSIGKVTSDELQPMAVVQNKRVVQPLEIFYNKKHNIVVVQALSGVKDLEWDAARVLISLYEKLNAKEMISIEGISSPIEREEPVAYYHTNLPPKKIEKAGVFPLKGGVVIGVSGALILTIPKNVKSTFIFAETHSKLPDSRAAAKVIQILDKYLGLGVDHKPLLKKAAEFEDKLRGMLQQTQKVTEEVKKKSDIAKYIS